MVRRVAAIVARGGAMADDMPDTAAGSHALHAGARPDTAECRHDFAADGTRQRAATAGAR